MNTKIVFALLMILFLIGCTTEVIEVGPEDINVTEPVETTSAEPATPPAAANETPKTNETAAAPAGHTVVINEWTFEPDDITIKAC